jgi:hypothetical protein
MSAIIGRKERDMDESTLNYVQNVIDGEGFDYAFIHYDDFNKVKDKEFHKLRKAYIKAQLALELYISKNLEETEREN